MDVLAHLGKGLFKLKITTGESNLRNVLAEKELLMLAKVGQEAMKEMEAKREKVGL